MSVLALVMESLGRPSRAGRRFIDRERRGEMSASGRMALVRCWRAGASYPETKVKGVQ